MSKLQRSTILQRAPELTLELGSAGQVTVSVGDRSFRVGPHGLAILDVFSTPRAMADGLELLGARCRGSAEWIELTTDLEHLVRAGALFDVSEPGHLPESSGGFDSPELHIQMLDDEARTRAYLDAIGRVVRPGDVVVDLGTGTGVLAMAAARAGARRVFAIEASAAATLANEMIRASGYEDRVVLCRGWSSRLELPEPADVLVSEIIGHEPLEEGVLEYTIDARKRMLSPSPRILPARVRISLQLVAVPEDVRARYTFTPGALARWGAAYGFDFTPLAGGSPQPPRRILVSPSDPLEPRSAETEVVVVDLAAISSPTVDAAGALVAASRGRVDGVLLTFRLDLTPDVGLSVAPGRSTRTNHWKLPLWLLPEPRDVEPGERIPVRYTYAARRARLALG